MKSSLSKAGVIDGYKSGTDMKSGGSINIITKMFNLIYLVDARFDIIIWI